MPPRRFSGRIPLALMLVVGSGTEATAQTNAELLQRIEVLESLVGALQDRLACVSSSSDSEDFILRGIDYEDRVIGVVEYLVEPFFAPTQRLLGLFALGDILNDHTDGFYGALGRLERVQTEQSNHG